MSYNGFNCRNQFTKGQIGVMLSSINLKRTSLGGKLRVLVDNFEPDYSAQIATPISLNSSQYHTFNWVKVKQIEYNDSDEDWLTFSIDTEKDIFYEIKTTAGTLSNPDTRLWLYHESEMFKSIAFDDNSNGGNFSKIVIRKLKPGKYYIKVDKKGNLPFSGVADYNISLATCILENDCFTGDVKAGINKIFVAIKKLSMPCNGNSLTCRNGSKSIFKSEHQIDFISGFDVENGAEIEASIIQLDNSDCISNEMKSGLFFNSLNQRLTNAAEILNMESIFQFDINPNPANGNFSISSSTIEGNQNINVQIFDSFGAIKLDNSYSNVIQNQEVNIDIQSLQAGLYVVKIINQSGKMFETRLRVE